MDTETVGTARVPIVLTALPPLPMEETARMGVVVLPGDASLQPTSRWERITREPAIPKPKQKRETVVPLLCMFLLIIVLLSLTIMQALAR